MKKTFKFLGRLLLMVLACATGASSDVLMANATDLPDAGVIEAGAAGTDATAGIATETAGRDYGDPDFYLEDDGYTYRPDQPICEVVRNQIIRSQVLFCWHSRNHMYYNRKNRSNDKRSKHRIAYQ